MDVHSGKLYLPCVDPTMFLHVSGRSDMSLSWNVLLVIAHPTMNWWITADLVWKRPSFMRIPEWADCWNNYRIGLNVRKAKGSPFTSVSFLCMPAYVLLKVSLHFHVGCRTMSSGSGCSAVGQLCTGREGWDEGGSSSLWSHPFFCWGPVSQAPNQLLLLATCVWWSACWACMMGIEVSYITAMVSFIQALVHENKHLFEMLCQYSVGWRQWFEGTSVGEIMMQHGSDSLYCVASLTETNCWAMSVANHYFYPEFFFISSRREPAFLYSSNYIHIWFQE